MALDSYKNQMAASSLVVMREKAVLTQLVNQDFSAEARAKNETISIPGSVVQAVHDVAPSAAAPALVQLNPSSVRLVLDQWVETYFDATDKDETEANRPWFNAQSAEAGKALINGLDAYLHLTIAGGSPYGSGVAGTTPFNDVLTEMFAGNEALNNGLADDGNRHLIVNTAAESNLMKQSAFSAANERGSNVTGLTGQLGRKFGYDCWMSQNVQKITRSTNAGAFAAAGKVGDQVITVDALGASGIAVGERLLIGSLYYHVKVGFNATAGTITLDRPLEVAAADNATLNRFGARTNNIMFQRECLTLAMRSPGPPSPGAGSSGHFSTFRDPKTGIVIQLEVQRLHAVTRYYFRMLYGAVVLYPKLAYQIFG